MVETDLQPKPYYPLQTILITVLVFFAAQLLGALLIGLIPLGLGWNDARTDAWLSDSPWAQFYFVLLVEVATIWLLWQFMRRRDISWRNIGWDRPQLKHVGLAVAGFAAYFLTYLLSLVLLSGLLPGFDLEQEQQLGFDKAAAGIQLLPIFISLVILPPLVEEIVARGFLYTGLRTKLSKLPSAVITSILFAAAHLGAAETGLLWVAAVDTFVLSMVMCYLRERFNSLWPSIGLHFIKNGIAFFILFNIAQYFR